MVIADIWAFGDDQHMHGGCWLNVLERQGVLGFVNSAVGNPSAQDFGKDVLIIINRL